MLQESSGGVVQCVVRSCGSVFQCAAEKCCGVVQGRVLQKLARSALLQFAGGLLTPLSAACEAEGSQWHAPTAVFKAENPLPARPILVGSKFCLSCSALVVALRVKAMANVFSAAASEFFEPIWGRS
jgi:hypothetical protein